MNYYRCLRSLIVIVVFSSMAVLVLAFLFSLTCAGVFGSNPSSQIDRSVLQVVG